jgi:hypothetical protein
MPSSLVTNMRGFCISYKAKFYNAFYWEEQIYLLIVLC